MAETKVYTCSKCKKELPMAEHMYVTDCEPNYEYGFAFRPLGFICKGCYDKLMESRKGTDE